MKKRMLARLAPLAGAAGVGLIGMAAAPSGAAPVAGVSAAMADKARLIVLTDVGSDPDDQQSLVRLLAYADDFDIEGIIATTSAHLRSETHREMIEERVLAYGKALPNLRVHDPAYPDDGTLLNRIRAGSPVYGMAGVGKGMDGDATRLIIAAVDWPDPRPVWIPIWGGAKELSQALWTVRATRSPAEVTRFVSRLRVYSISDQDDAGPWARQAFPELFWIASIHAFGDYAVSEWLGMAAPLPGSDTSVVSPEWVDANIRGKGPLGAVYPRKRYLEGDTPSFLYLMPNGLGSAEHPDWGSWGGRYGSVSPAFGLWTDTRDMVVGADGRTYADTKAAIWRWRGAYQNDFAARMAWSVSPRFADANHRPTLRLNGVGGLDPVKISACYGEAVRLSAAGSTDVDGQPPTYRWLRYGEVTGRASVKAALTAVEGPETAIIVTPPTLSKETPVGSGFRIHIILEGTDNGAPALTSYRRAIITVPDPRSAEGGSGKCPA